MLKVKVFTFNGFQENTLVVYNEKKNCIVFDPGCSNSSEEKILSEFISSEQLRPVRLINTHCHIDHILGNEYVCRKYSLLPEYHSLEQQIMDSTPMVANMYGVPYTPSPIARHLIEEGDQIHLDSDCLTAILCPGHSPGSLVFYDGSQTLIAGDVLFLESIGRTDLPGGNHADLLSSISNKLYKLDDQVVVYPGHGPTTTIGHEKKNNPFVKE